MRILNQEIDEDHGVYRVQHGDQVGYLTIASNVFDEDTMCRPHLLIPRLPPLPTIPWTRLSLLQQNGAQEFTVSNDPLPTIETIWHSQKVDVLTLKPIEAYRSNVYQVEYNGTAAVVKIAAFDWRMPQMENETKVYERLEDEIRLHPNDRRIAPRVLAQITENGRVIGLLLEKLVGRFATLSDLAACESTVTRLHNAGVVHGDLNRYNFIVDDASDEVKLLDFEHAEPWEETKASQEISTLSAELQEDTGRGGPPIERRS